MRSTESGFDEQHSKYREKITSRVIENNSTASNLIQSWLSGDHRNLPRTILSHLDITISVTLDNKTEKNYEILRSASSATVTDAGVEPSNTGALQFAYSFSIDPAELEFWKFRRSIADLGVRELMLPVGMKAPVSEKIKQKFRFGSRKDAEVNKEPEFVKADAYFLVSATLRGNKTLTIELARDLPVRKDSNVFRVSYDVASLTDQNPDRATLPRIDYISMQDGSIATEPDLLQLAEIKVNTDISKLRLLGAAILSRARILQDPQLLSSRAKLVELRIQNDDVIIPSALQQGDYGSLFKFLVSIAQSYSPFVKKMQEKTPVKGELTLKEELGGGQRKEYSARVEELRTQLMETENGKAVAFALGF